MPPYIPKNTVTLLAKIPTIPARQVGLTQLYGLLKTLLDRSRRTKVLPIFKYAICSVLLLNFGSFPFVWHVRVLWPMIFLKLKYLLLRFKLAFVPEKQRALALIAWGENLSPVGSSPFQINTAYRRWASIDDIDMYGMHLSNSSYAKALDSARVKALVQWFPTWGRSGGQMALGATHFHFIREIAPLVRYEVRLTIGSWDHKWLYMVARFVTHSNHRSSRHSSQASTPNHTPVQNGTTDIEQAISAIIHDNNGTKTPRRAPIVEPDGAILHCVAVSQICFRLDRITIPPSVTLASEGFTKPYGDGVSVSNSTAGMDIRPYSHTNPPPNWVESQSLRVPPIGNLDNFSTFLKGRWRDIPDGERWWEDALGGSIETKRQANLEIIESLKLGLERTRTLY